MNKLNRVTKLVMNDENGIILKWKLTFHANYAVSDPENYKNTGNESTVRQYLDFV